MRRAGRAKQRLRLWLALLRATRYVEAELREEMRRVHDSTLPRFDVLAALDRHRDGLLMGELSQQLMVSNGNVTGIVDRLVDDRLVDRLPVVGDRRATRVRLTPAGSRTFAGMAAKHERWVERLLSQVSDDETQTLTDLLSRIRKEPS